MSSASPAGTVFIRKGDTFVLEDAIPPANEDRQDLESIREMQDENNPSSMRSIELVHEDDTPHADNKNDEGHGNSKRDALALTSIMFRNVLFYCCCSLAQRIHSSPSSCCDGENNHPLSAPAEYQEQHISNNVQELDVV